VVQAVGAFITMTKPVPLDGLVDEVDRCFQPALTA
jgi:hypothetical protein